MSKQINNSNEKTISNNIAKMYETIYNKEELNESRKQTCNERRHHV